MVVRLKMGWFLFILAPALRSWSCATLAFVWAEPPRRPWQVLGGNEAGGLLGPWNRTAHMSSCGSHFRSRKGAAGENAEPRNREVSEESSVPGQCRSGVWRAL